MKSATRILVSTLGALVGLMGVEHGVGEVLQGNTAPVGLMFPSWPDSAFFQSLAGEPALTIVPNLLATGILAILISLGYLVGAVWFVQRRYGSLALMLISIPMLLTGGGIFPPIFGILLGAAATRINTPLTWWRAHLSPSLRHWLERLWPWSFGTCIFAWLCMCPGVPALSYFLGVNDDNLIYFLLILMFGSLFLTFIASKASDAQGRVVAAAG